MTIATDQRKAADFFVWFQGTFAAEPAVAEEMLALATRLRAHADLLDALRDRMARDLFREDPVPRFICDKWLEALYTGSLE